MPQLRRANRWQVIAAFALVSAMRGAVRLAPLLASPRLAFAVTDPQQIPNPFPTNPPFPFPAIGEQPKPMTPKQKDKLLKYNFKKTQQDADQLFQLAKSLKEDLDKSNANILSLQVVTKAKKIEKLAKKIKSEAVEN